MSVSIRTPFLLASVHGSSFKRFNLLQRNQIKKNAARYLKIFTYVDWCELYPTHYNLGGFPSKLLRHLHGDRVILSSTISVLDVTVSEINDSKLV